MRREIDSPPGDLVSIVERLCAMSRRSSRAHRAPVDSLLDYTAELAVFDVETTGRVFVVWTATFTLPAHQACATEVLADAVFRDSAQQLARELLGTRLTIDPIVPSENSTSKVGIQS